MTFFSTQLVTSTSHMLPPVPDHPYRIVVTNGGARRAVVSLVKVLPGTMPTRRRSGQVTELLAQSRPFLPPGVRTGVCMPPRPSADACTSAYARMLFEMYLLYDRLVGAPETV